jgi:MOSC domain-containing protein YiiM
MRTLSDQRVFAVSADAGHHFSKPVCEAIRLIVGHGVEGDAHGGPYVKHRHLARRRPRLANERQVHLIEAEVLDALAAEGFDVKPGALGENIMTRGVDLRRMPLGTCLHLGASAIVELRGLRTPCVLIDRLQKGLLRALICDNAVPRFRAGVMGIVRAGGWVRPGDHVGVTMPETAAAPLPAI